MKEGFDRKEWLANLKPGDVVVKRRHNHPASYEMGKVTNRTPSGMIDVVWSSNPSRAVRHNSDGWERGGALRGRGWYSRGYLEPYTEEVRERLQRHRVVWRLTTLRESDFTGVSTDTLLQILALLQGASAEESG